LYVKPDMDMKKLVVLYFALFTTVLAHAQSEIPGDSLTRQPSEIKMYGDFMFDMGLMTLSAPTLPTFNLLDVPFPKNYNEILFPETRWTFGQGYTGGFSTFGPGYYGHSPLGNSSYMQSATLQLRGNARLTLYGEYTADGWRRRDPSALPWQRNDFKGAVEFKSGNFGVRLEVQRRGNPYFPY